MTNVQKHLEKAIQINPKFTDAHYELALIHIDRGEDELSKQYLLKALKIQPKFPKALFQLALLLKKMKK